jgi:hypothetical protein
MEDLNLEIHGYATQGFIYTTNNNWNTLDTSEGSSAWSEAVLNISVRPESRLRIGVQGRYFLLGSLSNAITLDWAQADYKVNERFGFRAGKVKSPMGLLNESQDIDPAQLWILLPESIYELSSRNSTLAHYGGVIYGTIPLGEKVGKIEYRAYGGERIIAANDGFFQPLRDGGLTLSNGLSGPMGGATVKWDTPVQGLMIGATQNFEREGGGVTAGPLSGTFQDRRFGLPFYFARLERGRLMIAAEYSRLAVRPTIQFIGLPPIVTGIDQREFYAMASYRVSSKLTGGLYYSSSLDHKQPVSSGRYQKDWALAARYDIDSFLYVKLEQHFVDGTEIGYAASDNPNGLQPTTRMTLLRLGVSF